MHKAIMKVPVAAFRDEVYYKLRLNYSNTDITFN